MSDDIEVNVRQIHEEKEDGDTANTTPVSEAMERLFLAFVGAASIAYEEAEETFNRMVARGEEVQKDGNKVVEEVANNLRDSSRFNKHMHDIGTAFERGFEHAIATMNIPTKQDIDELGKKITHLQHTIDGMAKK